MAVYSVVSSDSLEGAIRLDAEYYQPKYLENRTKILGLKGGALTLGEMSSSFKKGIFDILAEVYSEEGVPFVRISNLRGGLIDDGNLVFIPKEVHEQQKQTALRRGDIILSKTAEEAASFVNVDECNISQDTIGIKLSHEWKDKIKSGYVVAFLNTERGLMLMRQAFQGNVQMHLALPDAKRIPVPLLSENFRNSIHELFTKGVYLQAESRILAAETQKYLLSKLRLLDWKPATHPSYVVNSTEVEKAQRMDSEYFQPKYGELLGKIANLKPVELSSLAQRITDPIDLGEDETYNYVEIGDVNSDDGEVTFTRRAIGELPANAIIKISGGELLVSTVRPTRGAVGVVPNEIGVNGVCSGAFSVFRVDSPMREYIQAVLRSIVGKYQMEKPTTGTSYPTITDDDVLATMIPTSDPDLIKEISKSLLRVNVLRTEGRNLIRKAKDAIDFAVESGLDKANSHIKAE